MVIKGLVKERRTEPKHVGRARTAARIDLSMFIFWPGRGIEIKHAFTLVFLFPFSGTGSKAIDHTESIALKISIGVLTVACFILLTVLMRSK